MVSMCLRAGRVSRTWYISSCPRPLSIWCRPCSRGSRARRHIPSLCISGSLCVLLDFPDLLVQFLHLFLHVLDEQGYLLELDGMSEHGLQLIQDRGQFLLRGAVPFKDSKLDWTNREVLLPVPPACPYVPKVFVLDFSVFRPARVHWHIDYDHCFTSLLRADDDPGLSPKFTFLMSFMSGNTGAFPRRFSMSFGGLFGSYHGLPKLLARTLSRRVKGYGESVAVLSV